MKIYPEAKKIAGANAIIDRCSRKLEEQFDIDGVDWHTATLIDGCKEKDGMLYKDGNRLCNGGRAQPWADYYCYQTSSGYCEDSWCGYLYFKTNVPGQFVRVFFDI